MGGGCLKDRKKTSENYNQKRTKEISEKTLMSSQPLF